jgi:hypothetical protein
MRKYGGHVGKNGGHMGKYGQNIMVHIIPRTYGKMHRTYGKMKKYEKISKKYTSDIWEKMVDMWQQNTSRTYGKIWRTYDCHPQICTFLRKNVIFFCHRCIRKIINSLRSVGNCFAISSSATFEYKLSYENMVIDLDLPCTFVV